MTDLVAFLRARLDEDVKTIEIDDQLGRLMWTEERLLAEVQAKRAILDLALGLAIHEEGQGPIAQDGDEILRHLALPYADHPDYRPDWISWPSIRPDRTP